MIHLAYCFDRNYQQHFGASVTSLLLNFGGNASELTIHVVTDELDPGLLDRLQRLGGVFKARFETHQLTAAHLQGVANLTVKSKAVQHLTTATYYRVLLSEVLPDDVDRVIYLDSDTIVLQDIAPLAQTDLQGATIAGVTDLSEAKMMARLGLRRYINSGVLLIDLRQWRQKRYTAACIDHAIRHPERIYCGDQCVVNEVLTDDLLVLDAKWNRFVLPRSKPGDVDVAATAVLHYITADKPWQAWYENPLARLYWRYLDVSPWRGAEAQPPTTITEARRLARLHHVRGETVEAVRVYDRIVASLLPS